MSSAVESVKAKAKEVAYVKVYAYAGLLANGLSGMRISTE
jgi:hypothetical protein